MPPFFLDKTWAQSRELQKKSCYKHEEDSFVLKLADQGAGESGQKVHTFSYKIKKY